MLCSDLDLSRVLLEYTSLLREVLGKRGVSLQEVMEIGDYIGLVSVLHIIKNRLEGRPLEEAIRLADKEITISIAEAEIAVLRKNPQFKGM